ncbi:4'-phosphopantetheinyl transferase family protein [Xylanimonas protaetiae]|uniref:4'-phosphopantetheinyl transferase family protein n=1 Tax=Xylanimonas protaetiae TaxID=2509457 RepID=UPI0013EA1252|nr:4'-phosphopantetheinyl transferase superfamily protein [Xylanimonas protaetiae]
MIVLRVLEVPDDDGGPPAAARRSSPLDAAPRSALLDAARRSALLVAVLCEAGVDVGEPVALVRRCRVCGSTEHGKPEVAAALAVGVHVSLAHTRRRLVAAAARGPVGVDVEDVAAVAAHPVADVLLSDAERAAGHPLDAESLTRTWVRKEALLKATGHGLHVPPSAVTLSLPGDGEPRLLGWDGPGVAPVPGAWTEERSDGLGLPASWVCAVALRPTRQAMHPAA